MFIVSGMAIIRSLSGDSWLAANAEHPAWSRDASTTEDDT